MRLIDADKLQKAIPAEEDNITGAGMTYDEMAAYNDGIDTQWKKIVNAPTIEPKPQWIPCSERLPEEKELVLLCDRYGDMTLGRLIRTDEGFKWDAYTWWNDIDDWNAWMPLPEPWKERKSDE